jgi:hypothetical protein
VGRINYNRVLMLMAEAKRRGLIRDSVADFCARAGFAEAYDWQQDVIGGNYKRLILNCSRQSGKSETASLKAIRKATQISYQTILIFSPSLRQSGELFYKVKDRNLKLKSTLIKDNELSCVYSNHSRISALPGSEATVRTYKANMIIVDEASRISVSLRKAISPMLAATDGELILISTPFGDIGDFYETWMNGGDEWKRIEVPATMVPHIKPEFLESERKALGEWWYNQEYMCKFMSSIDSVFSRELIMQAFDGTIDPLFEDKDKQTGIKSLCFT